MSILQSYQRQYNYLELVINPSMKQLYKMEMLGKAIRNILNRGV